jgi:hypothetical protein
MMTKPNLNISLLIIKIRIIEFAPDIRISARCESGKFGLSNFSPGVEYQNWENQPDVIISPNPSHTK